MTPRDVRWHSMYHDVVHALHHEERARTLVMHRGARIPTTRVVMAACEAEDARHYWVAALRCLLEVCR